MTLESNLNPNDLQPPPRITGSLILIHAVSGLCCGIFGLLQMIQPDFFASQFVSGYEGPEVPQTVKVVGFVAMAPLPLLVGLLLGLAAPTGVGLWLMGGRGARLQERLDLWRVATGGRP